MPKTKKDPKTKTPQVPKTPGTPTHATSPKPDIKKVKKNLKRK